VNPAGASTPESPSIGPVLADPVTFEDIGLPQLTAETASAIAVILGRGSAKGIARSLRADRGGRPVDFDDLVPCGPPRYARTLFDLGAIRDEQERHLYGPKWLVALCANGEPQLSIAVSSLATDLAIQPGLVRVPSDKGQAVHMKGIPPSWTDGLPITIHEAAAMVTRVTGKPATSAPTLVAPHPAWVPHAAQWHFRVSQGSAGDNSGTDLLVGLRLDGESAVGPSAVIVQALAADVPPPATEVRKLRPGAPLWLRMSRFTPFSSR
jgi:hypothetical protein